MGTITALDGAKIADAVYRFEPQVGAYTIAKDEDTKQQITYNDPDIGLQLALYQSTQGNYVIAVRGTEPFALDGDMTTNARMFVSTLADMLPSAFVQALQFIEPLMETYGLNSSNTSIVGHSMGGSIAQYLGSAKGFETLTYNAYGVGDMNMVPSGSGENITNYITMHDFVSPLPGSQMVGTTYMLQDEDLTDVFGHGITNFTSIESWVRGYSPVDGPRSIDVIDGIGSSGLDSAYELALRLYEGREFAMINGSMDDVIFGGDIDNILLGGGGNDTFIGGKGSDTLEGGEGNDTLIGGIDANTDDGAKDILQGGKDFDTYLVNNGDTIMDSDGKGIVSFEGSLLSGGKLIKGTTDQYEGDGGVYTLSEGTLIFRKNSGETLTINNYVKDNNDLKITLRGDDDKDMLPPDDDKDGGGTGSGGSGNYSSPLVLDLNANGNTSEFIYNTNTHFDMDGDNLKERTAWIESGDGLLTLDKNQDGIVNNGGELFGNYSNLSDGRDATDGFNALSDYDENNDSKIDAKDNVYNSLKVWQDFNQDGITDAGELKTLQELNISSINLDATTVDDTESRNKLSHTSTFTQDGVELAINDVWFRKDSDDVTYEFNGSVAPEIQAMPEIKGSGRVKNLSHVMSEDATLKTKVQTLLNAASTSDYNTLLSQTKDVLVQWTHTDNISASQTRGEMFVQNHQYANPSNIQAYRTYAYARDIAILENFAGREFTMYADGKLTSDAQGNKAADTIQALKTFDINNDGKVDSSDNSGLAFWTDRNHNGLTDVGELEALGAAGAIQTIKFNPYQTLLSGYDNNHDGEINSNDKLYNYLYIQTNPDESVTLYLPDNAQAKEMIAGYTGGESIQTPQGEKIIKTILFYEGYGMNDKRTLSTSQNYTSISSIHHLKQDILSQSLKEDIINNSFFIFNNNLHVDMKEVA